MDVNIARPQVVIIGAGPTGLYAAFQVGLMGMRPVIIEALHQAGGQCTALYPASLIHDAPATPAITGEDLARNLMAQMEPFSPLLLTGRRALSVWGSLEGGFNVETDTGETITGAAVIYAGGPGAMQPRRLDVKGVETLSPEAISYGNAETMGRRVAVIGDGEPAVTAALDAAQRARAVTLIHETPLRADDAKIDALHHAARARRLTVINGHLEDVTSSDGKLKTIGISVKADRLDQPADLLLVQAGLEYAPAPVTGLAPIRDAGSGETDIRGMFIIGDAITSAGNTRRPPVIAAGFSEALRAARAAAARVMPGAARTLPHTASSPTLRRRLQVA